MQEVMYRATIEEWPGPPRVLGEMGVELEHGVWYAFVRTRFAGYRRKRAPSREVAIIEMEALRTMTHNLLTFHPDPIVAAAVFRPVQVH